MIKPFLCICCIAASLYLFATTTVPGITAVYDTKKKVVNIQWQQKQAGIKSYVVQRSTDNSTWTDIAFQGIVNYDPGKTFQFVDYRAANGENYYRLKCVTEKAQIEYSTSIMVIAGAAESNWIMYPVPVKDVLTLQYKGTNKIMGVVNVFIHNITGRIITRVRSASLNTIIRIPVDNLGSGVYDVRIIIEEEQVWSQRFVK